MDRVRFGRAIGTGTRDAARALLKAADAATSPDPNGASTHQKAREAGNTAAHRTVRTAQQVRATAAGVQQGSKRFGEAIWGPFVKLSGVLWLEVTGVFFGLFAMTAGVEVWKRRADLHATGEPRQHVLFAVAMFAVFAYFTLSSFLRARRRGRR